MSKYDGVKVEIIGNFGGHYFQKGDIVRIVEKADHEEDYGQGYKAEYLDGHDYWYIYENEHRSEFKVVGE